MLWTLLAILFVLIELAVLVRVMLRPHRDPSSRVAWIAVVSFLPIIGMMAYLMFGEVNIGRRRIERMRKVIERMPPLTELTSGSGGYVEPTIPAQYQHLFRAGQSVNGFEPLGGNSARLLADSNTAIDSMVADIDAATEHVHLMFYIWLPDHNGLKMVEALKRAAGRGVTCRAMVDDLGSRNMVRSEHWKSLQTAGVNVAVALPIGNPLVRPLKGRIDLRNHRKILVIDGRITYCGSQNCADPEFRVKAKFAPWVDAVARFEGPVVRQNQHLFASDWMTYADENIDELLTQPLSATRPGFPAQVIGTGPTVRFSAMPEIFESLFYAARRELVVTTPYYVPDESMQNALAPARIAEWTRRSFFPPRTTPGSSEPPAGATISTCLKPVSRFSNTQEDYCTRSR